MIELVEKQRSRLDELCRSYRVKRLELFGSAIDPARFEQAQATLISLSNFSRCLQGSTQKHIWPFLNSLQDLFKLSIDLIEIKAVANPYLLESINETRSPIYAA